MTVKASERPSEKTCNTEGCNAWATKESDRTRCRNCGGESTGPKTEEGKRKVSGNAETHSLTSDPKSYKKRQSESDADWIRSVRESILDRMRFNNKEPDFLDEVLAERVAIQLHMVNRATEYVDDNGLIQTVFIEDGGYEKDIPQGLVDELRKFDKDIIGNLKKLGVLDDPESKKAEASRELGDVVAEALEPEN